MVFIKDRQIINPEVPDMSHVPSFEGTCLADEYFRLIRDQVEKEGDVDFVFNADLGILNKERDSISQRSTKISELEEKSRPLARSLHSLGLGKGDYVHLLLPNNASFYFPVFATWLCQGIVSLADPTLSKQILQLQIGELKSKLVVCTEETKEKVVSILNDLGLSESKILIVGEGEEDRLNNVYSMSSLIQEGKDLKTDPDSVTGFHSSNVVLIVWSSGTTGKPKGIQLTCYSIASVLFKTRVRMMPGKHTLQTTCFFHAGGFFTPFYGLKTGDKSIFFAVDALDGKTEKIFQAIDMFKPMLLILGSHHVVRLADFKKEDIDGMDLSSVKMLSPLGSPIPQSAKKSLRSFFPSLFAVLNVYGMSEVATAMIAMAFTSENLGQPAPGVTVKITDPATGESLGLNEVGEIRAKLEHPLLMMAGYLNRPEETKAFFGDHGFVHTGDLGSYDENGTLHFGGRLKELIKVNNCHLYPIELDEIIHSHPDVIDVGVFSKPDPTVQELVMAAVVKRPGSSLTEKDVIKLVESQADDFKRLRGGVVFVDSLPRSQQGKILRRKLSELYGQ